MISAFLGLPVLQTIAVRSSRDRGGVAICLGGCAIRGRMGVRV